MTNNERFDFIKEICLFMHIDKCQFYMKKMPFIEEDPSGEKFNNFSAVIQYINSWRTTSEIEKCTIAQGIIELNKDFEFPIANIQGYYLSACLEDANQEVQQPTSVDMDNDGVLFEEDL